MPQFTAPLPLSLYIHIPWCVRKCPYCDFNSHQAPGEKGEGIPEEAYVEALISDLEQELPAVWGRRVETVFIGGGTPSLLSPEALERLLSAVRSLSGLKADAEVTLEANPGTVERGKFTEFRAAGINRLSIGIQSFHDEQLQALGRIHDRRAAIAAAEAAHAAGFDNFNLDLMFGLPGQDLARSREDLATAIALEPTHLSWYQLTIEPNTAFHHAPPPLPEDDELWTMHASGQEQLAAAGYKQYEVSAYAKGGARDGYQCRHNINYWQFGDYLGVGAGAHGKVTDAPRGTIGRYWKLRHPRDFMQAAGSEQRIQGSSVLSEDDVAFEFMMNALRLNDGFAERLFDERTGLSLQRLEPRLREAEDRGLLLRSEGLVAPTELGRNHLNTLLEMFLPEAR